MPKGENAVVPGDGQPKKSPPGAADLFLQHCAECHGKERLGGMGPALLPENLGRLRKTDAADVIANSRPAVQMPKFADKLAPEQIQSLVDYIFTALPEVPRWGMEEIAASRQILVPPEKLHAKPVHSADPMNMFVVVELGDHHATILDGDKFEPIHRFKTRFALHGGPKYSPDGRFVYFTSRDGWISKFDMYSLQLVAEARAGINARNSAISDDGRYLIVANYLPHTLALLNTEDLSPVKVIDVKNEAGVGSRVSAVYTADPRHSFVAALKDLPEVWEINYQNPPPDGFGEWMHDYRADSGEGATPKRFPIRKIQVSDYLDDFFFSQDYSTLIGSSRKGGGQVVDLDLGRTTHKLKLPGMPHLGSGITWTYKGRRVMATPNLKESTVTIIDMENWKVIKQLKTLGPGFFMRSHENSPYAWVDVFFGPNKDAVHIIDKEKLKIVKTLRPEPGKTAAHVEFDKDGGHALLSIWELDGAVIVYDAKTLEEVKRLPMVKPSGKYNVHNKITRSEGTSH
ncbi:MAG: nitrite reductase [Gammaproteobacteria bacterium]|nr:nitrite reductase [Gammaproteobacteria bacterium]MBU1655902.1 nitrite reductase [Gammaproteobacteria bacterium]MBU1961001.1 nitrite reductase [Gammaproteobacteria bacterium]